MDASQLGVDQATENAALNGLSDRVRFQCCLLYTSGGRDDDPKRKYYRKGHTARWAAGIAAAAVLFGIVTGGTIGLVNLAADRMANSSQVEQSAEERCV